MEPRRQSGNVTLFVILGLFVLGLAGGLLFIFGPSSVDETAQRAKDAKAAYDEAVLALDRALSNPSSCDASLEHNSATFNCLFSGDGNCKGQGGAFLLFEQGQSRHPLSHLASDSGTDAMGAPCKGYPSKDCPLRVETVWEPVCAGAACESTKSAKVKAKVTLAPVLGDNVPLEWTKDVLCTPAIQLSKASQCGRNGGVWTGNDCLSPAQVAERRIASPNQAREDVPPAVASDVSPAPPAPVPQIVYECPNQIVVQGAYYPVQFLSADRGQVTVQAMSCPQPGATDVFVFQCTAKSPQNFPNEGQWIQVEAAMAPACDSQGNPTGNMPVRF